jgi:hypothetical protein
MAGKDTTETVCGEHSLFFPKRVKEVQQSVCSVPGPLAPRQFAPRTTRPIKTRPKTSRPKDNLPHRQLAPWTTRPRDNLPQGQLAPWTTRPMDNSPHGQLAPWTTRPTDNWVLMTKNWWCITFFVEFCMVYERFGAPWRFFCIILHC